MEEIVQLLQDRAGLSPEVAREVAQLIVEIVKSKVPAEFQGIVGTLLGEGQTAAAGQPQPAEGGGLGSLIGGVEGLFGGHKG